MKAEEKRQARALRFDGRSLSEIMEKIPSVSKNSIARWVRDIPLSKTQIQRLENKQTARHERFSETIRHQRIERWAKYHDEARIKFNLLKNDAQFMFGLALYIGEGDKNNQNSAAITNCDPKVIKKALLFMRYICGDNELRCRLQVPANRDRETAEEFWSKLTYIPRSLFGKTIRKVSPTSRGERGNRWPNGICTLVIHSTRMKQMLNEWMRLALAE